MQQSRPVRIKVFGAVIEMKIVVVLCYVAGCPSVDFLFY